MERQAASILTDMDLAALFPMPVQACVARPGMEHTPLTPEEDASIAGASLERRAEFALGRAALKAALARLGATGVSAPSRPDRSPVLPSGFAASLSHCPGFCAAVAARAEDVESLGFDAEPCERLSDDLAALVLGPLDGPLHGMIDPRLAPILVFSAKEAVYKCQHPLAGAPLDFADLGIQFHRPSNSRRERFSAVFRRDLAPVLHGRRFEGSWRRVAGLVLAAAWPEPPTGGSPPP